MVYKLSDQPSILVIDDELSARLVLEGLLSSAGVNLYFAGSSQSGLEKAAEMLPDAIILDIMMPEMNGYEVCRRLRANPNLSETHILMLTALDERDARLEGLRAGADDFISKPYDGLELQLRLKAVLRSSRYRRLQAERARFAWIVENSDTGYLVLNKKGEILYSNASANTLLNLPEAKDSLVLQKHISKYFDPHPKGGWDEWITNPSPCFLVQPEQADSAAFWLLLDALDLPLGQFGDRIVRVSDITDKISLNNDMRRFHSIVSHKLRTPVSLLYSSMSLVERKLDSIPVEDVKSYVRMAWESSQQMVSDIHDILNFISAPELLRSKALTHLDSLQGIVSAIQEKLNLKPVALYFSEDLCGQKLKLNPYALEACLYEILENAQKFHPQNDPSVEIRAEAFGANQIRMVIQDNGISLTPKQIQWAMRPYFQGEKYFTGETKGMGLGIPTVSTILWQAGGDVQIAPRQDQPGTLITLIIPLSPAQNHQE
jgi:two-component system, cell cycle response regulator